MARKSQNRQTKPRSTRDARERVGYALFDLFWELSFTYLRLNTVGHRLAASARQSPGKVSLLRSLAEEGPQSVAQLARSRSVARQGVQLLSDQIVADGLAEYFENPTHRRAKLMRITGKGSEVLASMLEEQRRLARRLDKDFKLDELKISTDVLHRLRALLLQVLD